MKKILFFLSALLCASTAFATVNVTTTRMQYDCNGTSTNYAYSFKVYADDELQVVKKTDAGVESTLVLNTNYTVTGVGTSGGNVVLTTGATCASGETLTIIRDMDLVQETDYEDGGGLSAETIEADFDKARMIDQQLQEKITRSIKLNISTELGEIDLPPPGTGELIGWNTSGDDLVTYSQTRTTQTLSATAVENIDELRLLTGVIGQSVQPQGYYERGDGGGGPIRVWSAASTCTDNGGSCLKPTAIAGGSPGRWIWEYSGPIDVKYFGAKGDGTTDDTVVTRKALDYVGSKTFGAELVWTEGTYYYPTTIYIPTTPGLKLTSKGAILKGAGAGTGTIFETGAQTYSTAGTTNWGFNEQYNHYNQSIIGFKFQDCKYGMKLFDFLEGSKANDNFGTNLVTLIYAQRSFYGDFKNNRCDTITEDNGAYGYEDAAFRFESFINVQSIEGNSVSHAKTGFYFAGGVSGLLSSNNSAESCNRGLMITGNVYGAEYLGWYFEGNDRDIHIESAAYKDGLHIDGCWLNSADAIYAESWRSGELGKNNYYGSNGTVNLGNSLNSVNVWLPRVIEGISTAYSSTLIPSGWTINQACRLHVQESRFTDAVGPNSTEFALSEDYISNQRVPRHYVGTSGMNVTPPAYTSTDVSVAGTATIDTKLVFHDRECGIRFDFVIRQGGVVVDRLGGWINGTTVFRDDASAKTVVASNNGGFYRIVISGYAASTLTVFGGVRIL